MGTDVFLEVVDHLFSMVKILDSEKDGHGEGEKTDQAKDDFKSETLVKLDLSHRRYPTSSNAHFTKGKEGDCLQWGKEFYAHPTSNFSKQFLFQKFYEFSPCQENEEMARKIHGIQSALLKYKPSTSPGTKTGIASFGQNLSFSVDFHTPNPILFI